VYTSSPCGVVGYLLVAESRVGRRAIKQLEKLFRAGEVCVGARSWWKRDFSAATGNEPLTGWHSILL
jgi:hypothetical protein